MALFSKKLTLEELLKAAAALSPEEKEKLRASLTGTEDEEAHEEAEEEKGSAENAEEPKADNSEESAEVEPEAPAQEEEKEDGGAEEEPAEEAAEKPESPQEPAESVEEETEEAREETTQDSEAEDHNAEMVKTLSDRVCALEETIKELSALKERMEEYDQRNAERFGYAGNPGKVRRSYDEMSAAELKAEILGR